MNNPSKELPIAFQRDHAVLGRGLHDLAVALRDGDILSAKRVAAEVDRDAGPHIAFEEQCFYPRVRDFLSDPEVDRFYAEHRLGQTALGQIMAMPDAAWPDARQMNGLLGDVELMERHVAECGALFAAMDLIPAIEQRTLLAQLNGLRASASCWTSLEALNQAR